MKTAEQVAKEIIIEISTTNVVFDWNNEEDKIIMDIIIPKIQAFVSSHKYTPTNIKSFVQKYMVSHESDTFIPNKNGVVMVYSENKKSGLNLTFFFEDLLKEFLDEIKEQRLKSKDKKEEEGVYTKDDMRKICEGYWHYLSCDDQSQKTFLQWLDDKEENERHLKMAFDFVEKLDKKQNKQP